MEELINQMRFRFSGSSSPNPRDRRLTPQKSVSFKGDQRKSQNWFERQFSRQMSDTNGNTGPSAEDEVTATAVAVTAFAVDTMLREAAAASAKKEASAKAKSRKDTTTLSLLEPTKSSLQSSGEMSMKEKGSPEQKAASAPASPGRSPTLNKRMTFADQLQDAASSKPTSSSPPKASPSFKEPPSFPQNTSPSIRRPSSFPDDKNQLKSNAVKPDSSALKPDLFPPIKPATPSSDPNLKTSTSTASRDNTNADAWERAELERIKERYDNLSSTILSWEDNKKKKARGKLDRTESELSRTRSKALQKFKEEMETINRIAGGARAQAEERRRNEELKAKEKANKYRLTGKLPRTCFCF